MKKMYRVSASRKYTKGVLILMLVLPLLVTCGQPEEDDDNYIVTTDEFSPENLPEIGRIFAFASDSVGYAATAILTKEAGLYYRDNYILSKTEDRGRTWTPVWKGKGECTTLSISGGNLYYVTHISDDRTTTQSEIWRTGRDRIAPELISRFDYGIYGFHVFNDSTYTAGMSPYDITAPKDTNLLVITGDSGKKWEKVSFPGIFQGNNYLAYDGNNIYAALSMYNGGGRALFIKDIITGKERLFPYRGLSSIVASDNLFTANPSLVFREYDGESMEPISSFRWNRGYGSYHPKFLIRKGHLAVCVSSQFPGERGKKQCIFGSIDGGYHWKPFLMGDDIRTNILYEQGKIAEIPDKDGVSIIFGRGGSNLHILTLKKKQE